MPSSTDSSVVGTSWENLPSHEDENQVGLDVDRSFVYYPKGRFAWTQFLGSSSQDERPWIGKVSLTLLLGEGEKQLGSRRDALRGVIVQTLRQHPYLRYFQGYHDIVQVFLLVLGHDRAVDCVARLSLLRIRDFMLPSLAAAMVHLHLIPPILKLVAPELEERLSRTQPFFALSATLTLYAHDIEEYSDIARLFDYFLSQPATVPVYFFAIIIRSRKDELLEVEEDEPEMLHSILSKLPKPLDLEDLIEQTIMLHTQNPPNTLPGLFWHRIDSDSVLKTTQPDKKVQAQTIDQGRRWFRSQQMTLKRRQTTSMISQAIWRYRRPVGSVGIAFTIAVIAILLRRETGSDTYMISAFKRIISLIK